MEISLLGFLLLILLAGVCGAIAKAIVGMRRGGLLASIGLGFIGGLIGVILADAADLPAILPIDVGGMTFPLVWALLGTVLVVLAVAAFSGRRPRHRHAW